jgi:hypothetical protein
MSEETTTTQDSTSADAVIPAQAQAPSEGGLMPAASIKETPAVAPVPAEVAPATPPDATEKDLGLLGKTQPAVEGAPEQYEAFVMPEGIAFDEAETGILQSIAKDTNLNQADAQKAAAVTGQFMQKLVDENEAKISAYKAEQKAQWDAQPDADERILLAAKALDHAGLKEHIMDSGYQHDANLMKVFSDFGKLLSEAKVIVGSDTSPAAVPNPYPNSPEFNR